MGMKFVPERDLEYPVIATHKFYYSWIKKNLRRKDKILDIGCWTGPLEHLLVKEDCEVTGIDIEDEPLKVARKNFPKFKFYKKSIIDGRPFNKEKFDKVLFFMVIEHIPPGTEEVALKNINKVLKKNGMIFLSTMANNPLSFLGDPAFVFGHRHYSKARLNGLLKKTGFSVKEVNYNGGIFNILYAFLLYFFKYVLRKSEPKGGLMDKLMSLGYKNNGFAEIDIRAQKVRDIN